MKTERNTLLHRLTMMLVPVLLTTCAAICSNGHPTAQTIKSFGSMEQSGARPRASLVLGRDGALYGTTTAGGSANGGTVFKINPDGSGYSSHDCGVIESQSWPSQCLNSDSQWVFSPSNVRPVRGLKYRSA